jgi:4-hydroxythreonine-4-phosphate dehydrogenase
MAKRNARRPLVAVLHAMDQIEAQPLLQLDGPMQPIIAISLGDPAGIGPEIAFKAAHDPRVRAVCRPVLVGDRRVLDAHAQACGFTTDVETVRADTLGHTGKVELIDIDVLHGEPLKMGEIAALHGRAAVDAAGTAIDLAMAGKVDAVVAAPQTELAIHRAGILFDGYPTFVARRTGTPIDDAFLMLCFDAFRIVHTTLHVSLRRSIELITPERVTHVLKTTYETLRTLGIGAPNIAVSGLNCHAGEGRLFGDEESLIIEPAIAEIRAQGINVEGPFGADTMFQKKGYDGFVVMFHDQGHIAAKLLATNRTAGLTIGTPILFSSVAHGSALDIAGKNLASPEAVVEAVSRLAAAAAMRAELAARAPIHA